MGGSGQGVGVVKSLNPVEAAQLGSAAEFAGWESNRLGEMFGGRRRGEKKKKKEKWNKKEKRKGGKGEIKEKDERRF